jgi:putative ABC transport system permease protein
VGRLLLILRLVVGDIKRRPVQAALLVVMILTTTTTLMLGLALRNVADNPFARTRAATRGPDVVAQATPPGGSATQARRQFASLLSAPGVTASSGPYPLAFVRLTVPHLAVRAEAEGRDAAPASLDQPALSSGSWIRPGGAVIERGFAAALGVTPGDTIHLGGRPFRVTGIAVSTAQCFYPVSTPGVIWVTRADALALATRQDPLGYTLNLKLADPAAADTFVNTSDAAGTFATVTQNDSISSLQAWLDIRHDDFRVINVDQEALVIGSAMLALLALASITVAVGGRMAEQTRRVGLLKAVGATPATVAVVLLAENLLLALAATAVGVAAGGLLGPLLTNPGSGLLGSAPAPSITAAAVAEVAAVALAVAAGATVAPAIRGARTSTVRALENPAHPPPRHGWLIEISSRLPVPLLLALRLVARRPRRAILTAASLAIAVTMVVVALTLQHNIDVRNHATATNYLVGPSGIERVSHLVFLLTAILVVLASVNAIFTTWASVIDAQRPNALARALGATPGQVSAGLTGAQLLPGVAAACLGIPAGLALYAVAGGHVADAAPPLAWLLAVVPGTLLVVALLTAIPARIGARRPVAEVLRSD